MAVEQAKEEVTTKIIAMFIESVGWSEKYAPPLDAIAATELNIDSDDLSFFADDLEKYFDMRLTKNEWGQVGTLRQAIDLVMRYRGVKLRPPPEPGFWAKLWACIK